MTQVGKVVSAQSLRIQHESGIQGNSGTDFAACLREQAENSQSQAGQIQFSRHAEQRMVQRGVSLSGDNIRDLTQAVERARLKGSKETVVIGKQGAFIVNVPNNIVVTTITEQEMRQNIFTNIDSAVFM
ncbi:MAG TPA: flagellar biosynthesis protein [Candidatus Mediterraneibacter norfolkensis]|nr:flagellar biosynthesis protein [Candidatus Mediterraneibacter norfolkensis]